MSYPLVVTVELFGTKLYCHLTVTPVAVPSTCTALKNAGVVAPVATWILKVMESPFDINDDKDVVELPRIFNVHAPAVEAVVYCQF